MDRLAGEGGGRERSFCADYVVGAGDYHHMEQVRVARRAARRGTMARFRHDRRAARRGSDSMGRWASKYVGQTGRRARRAERAAPQRHASEGVWGDGALRLVMPWRMTMACHALAQDALAQDNEISRRRVAAHRRQRKLDEDRWPSAGEAAEALAVAAGEALAVASSPTVTGPRLSSRRRSVPGLRYRHGGARRDGSTRSRHGGMTAATVSRCKCGAKGAYGASHPPSSGQAAAAARTRGLAAPVAARTDRGSSDFPCATYPYRSTQQASLLTPFATYPDKSTFDLSLE